MTKVAGVRTACKIISNIFDELRTVVVPGVTTKQIDAFCQQKINQYGAVSAAYQYPGQHCKFPGYVCISINHEVCHGVPSSTKVIQTGDIVSIDICIQYQSYFGDSCITFIVGTPNTAEDLHLVQSGYQVMYAAIKAIKPGVRIGTLGHIMQSTAQQLGYNVIYDFCGHFIGHKLHLEPDIPFFGIPNTGPALREGDCLTIEPMISAGSAKLKIDADGWTAYTVDHSNTCQFEHCVAVTKTGYEILSSNFIDNTHTYVLPGK
jgi:methionyl aminopeptidase